MSRKGGENAFPPSGQFYRLFEETWKMTPQQYRRNRRHSGDSLICCRGSPSLQEALFFRF